MTIMGQTAVSSQNVAQERIRCYLLARGDTFAVEDGPAPFLWYWVNSKEEVVPVKVAVWGDSFERKVIYLETEREGSPGLVFSDSHYLFYYYLTTQKAYLLPVAGLRDLCEKYWQSERREVVIRHGETYKVSRGIEVPLVEALALPRAKAVSV